MRLECMACKKLIWDPGEPGFVAVSKDEVNETERAIVEWNDRFGHKRGWTSDETDQRPSLVQWRVEHDGCKTVIGQVWAAPSRRLQTWGQFVDMLGVLAEEVWPTVTDLAGLIRHVHSTSNAKRF